MSEYEVELYIIMGNMLREIRNDRGITLDQVSEKTGLTAKTIQRYETGERKIKISTVIELSSILDFDYNKFMAEAKSKLTNNNEPLMVRESSSYYTNDETRQIAQEIFENKDMRLLFDAVRDISPDRLKAYVDLMKALKDKEDRNN